MKYSLLSYFLDENRFTNFPKPFSNKTPMISQRERGEVVHVVVY